MANYYSGGYGPVCDHALAGRTLENALFFLARRASAFDLLRLGPLDKSTELALAAEASLRRSGFSTRWHFAFGNWYADVRGLDYHAYLERAPSSFPATCEKRRRAFLRRNIGELQIVSDLVGIERYIEEYLEVYRSSWKIPEPFPDFIPGLIRLAAERGWLRLGIARVDGKPVAAQVWFVVGSKALIYKVAYDERFSKLSIGSILTAELIRRAIDTDNVSELDFLSGDDAYKAKWMFARRERHALWAFNLRRPRGALTWVRHLAGARIASFRSAMARRTELVSSPVK